MAVPTLTLILAFLGYAAFCALMIVPLWRVFDRAGLSPWFALLFAVPFAGPLIVLFLLAFMDWPSIRRNSR